MSDPDLEAASALLRELVDGPPGPEGSVLNPGDPGLLRSLVHLSADAASAPGVTGASVAGHVAHLVYGLSLLNRWADGEAPFADADYSASWRTGRVSADEWTGLRARLEAELRAWSENLSAAWVMNGEGSKGVLASIVHLAYHLGAIRQIASEARGPRARD